MFQLSNHLKVSNQIRMDTADMYMITRPVPIHDSSPDSSPYPSHKNFKIKLTILLTLPPMPAVVQQPSYICTGRQKLQKALIIIILMLTPLRREAKMTELQRYMYSQLSLSPNERDPLKHLEISVLQHIRFAELRKIHIEQPNFTNKYVI